MNQLRDKIFSLRFWLVPLAVGVLFQASLVSFHQGRHASESLARSPVSGQTTVHDLENAQCTFCTVLHVSVDAGMFIPVLTFAWTPESFDALLLRGIDSRLSLALPGARGPPHALALV